MKRLLISVAIVCLCSVVSAGGEPLGLVAYKGKINYKVFTGFDLMKAKLNVILLRNAATLDDDEYYLVIDEQNKLAWLFLAGEKIEIWQENDGQNDLDVVDMYPSLHFDELNGLETIIWLEPGGFAKQKSVETGFVPPSAEATKNTVVDVFKSMPIKGIAWTTVYVPVSAAGTPVYGIGSCTGNLRYNKKLTEDLNADSEILGDPSSAAESLQGDLEDDGYDVTVVGGG